MDDTEKKYTMAMAHLEAGVAERGLASVKFKDGEMVMLSLDLLRELISSAEEKGQDRVIVFIGVGPELKNVEES
jgi:DUF971 family protein